MSETKTIPCRLCGQSSTLQFSKRVLERYSVAYYRCGGCQSIQTEVPYWLDEAYAIPGVHIDVGGASRTLKNWAALSTLLGRLSLSREAPALDFGAASGLLGRLMRDVGYNFYSHDKFARPAFTSYHNVDEPAAIKPQLITAFEVFEHLPQPKLELERLFSINAPLIVFTTWFCDGQDAEWIYYIPECGQHVFFYSEQAMRDAAGAHGYELRSSAFFHYLSKPDAFSDEQNRVIADFSVHGAAWAREDAGPLLASVWLGNSFIDEDFVDARRRFIAERQG
jgi:Methyltransferase domain